MILLRSTPFIASAILLAGCGQAPDGASALPAAAVVDKVAISQAAVTLAVPDADTGRRAVQLDAFVTEQVLAAAAVKAKLDADPVNQAALETARREILARAYVRLKSKDIPHPDQAEIAAYYADHPLLFALRRIYRLQEIAIQGTPEQVARIERQVGDTRTFAARADKLQQIGVPFSTAVAVKAAEDLPQDLLIKLGQMRDGAGFTLPNARGAAFMQITGIEEKPMDLAQATPLIERFLLNLRLGQLINQETKRLRGAASVSYVAPYSAPATPAAPAAKL